MGGLGLIVERKESAEDYIGNLIFDIIKFCRDLREERDKRHSSDFLSAEYAGCGSRGRLNAGPCGLQSPA